MISGRNELAYCPDWSRDNPYQKLLYKSIGGLGIPCKGISGQLFTLEWLIKERKTVRYLHFHWLFGIYDPNSKGLDWKKATTFLLKILAARLLGYKILWTVHNFISHEPSHRKLEVVVRKSVSRLVNHVIVHCEYAKKLLQDEWGVNPHKIAVIPHGSYIGFYKNEIPRSEARKMLQIPEIGFIFLFFGMVRNYKGLKQLLKSFAEVKDITPQIELIIAGKPFNDSIKNEIESKADDMGIHHFLRFIPDDEVQMFFNAADVVILPYQNILTSGAALLSLSFGKPLIVPARGCIPELIDDKNGFTYLHDRELTETMLRAVREIQDNSYNTHALETAQALNWDALAHEKYHPLLMH